MWSLVLVCCLLITIVTLSREQTQPKPKICVIGAGGGGLAAIKEFASYPDELEPIGFEINLDVGGLWIYSDDGDLNKHGLPTRGAVYKNLRTNTPKVLMAFPDFQQFGGENRSCVKHETVVNYLKNYTDHFNFRSYIRFNTLVEKVSRVVEDDWETTRWYVQTRDLITNQSSVTTCNAVVIGNGKNFKTKVPIIPGIDGFAGRIIHSHAYRRPEDYINQTVVLLGAGNSGIDIAFDLSPLAKKVYLSHRHDKIKGKWPNNVVQVRGVVAANGNELTLQDGSKIVVDSFIYCTGYVYDFPFLDKSSNITFTDKFVRPVYERMINAYYPTMSFLGLPVFRLTINFSRFHVQAKYIAALLRRKIQLPSQAERLIAAEQPDNTSVSEAQWVYYKKLADAGGFEALPDYYRQASVIWRNNKLANFLYYKDSDIVLENGTFIIKYRRRND